MPDAELAGVLLDLSGADLDVYRARMVRSRGGWALTSEGPRRWVYDTVTPDADATPGGMRCAWCGAEFPYGAHRDTGDRSNFYRAHYPSGPHRPEIDAAARRLALSEIQSRVNESRSVPVFADAEEGEA